MADAEIIPLGTRGRPGRGSGNAKPSSAARTLAGSKPGPGSAGSAATGSATGSATDRSPADPPGEFSGGGASGSPRRRTSRAPDPETGASTTDSAAPGGAAGPTKGRPTGTPRATGSAGSGPAAAQAPESSDPDRPPVTTSEQEPDTGIPVADWLEALASAGREVFGEGWERRTAELLAFLRRRVTGDYSVDAYGFDPEVTERFFLAAVRPLKEKWFRVEVRGAENIPAEGGALLVSNHSGTVPVDGLMTMVSVHDHTGRNLRPLGADLVFRLPVFGELARKAGATLACNEDAERMLRGGELVGVWPEGFKGIGKPYSERYKLQRFGRGGFVSAALRTGVPIIPCSVVGAEEIYPLVGNLPSLARLLGVPYIPITPFFPLLGPLGLVPLPSKWLIEFGEPIRTDSYDEGAADDPMLVFNVTDQVRETIQQTLYTLLMQRRSVFH
ncbi:lysophospholipid acyltransferase family protein [Nocardioides mesophilus]|uniref:1-acyl-sn-glycerol-3-phosphate acyltransferase n=1 Tax=Nocardioides mesophilus TaxID=433659 RepID=A0A7G9R6M4_9ACTN|nr:lysophospholipid acyltransferase family protein [Nocardioides mesophilus]QNN51249.1 1-acyl-sn-glycerol-3-phosphate acyltransferase [Nocardioides mesophilus]